MPGWKALAITAPTPATVAPPVPAYTYIYSAEGRLAVGEEIVDEQYAVARVDELRFERELVAGVLGEGKDLRLDDALLQDAGLGLFEDDHGHIQRLRGHHRRGDARGLDGGHAGDALARKQAGKLRAHFAHQIHVHLVVQEGIHQQNILREGAPSRSIRSSSSCIRIPTFPIAFLYSTASARVLQGARREKARPADNAGAGLSPLVSARGRRRWRTPRRRCPVPSPRARIWRSARG